MKKILSILLTIFCIFSFNACFNVGSAIAEPQAAQAAGELPELPMDGQVDDDVLREPIFTPENKKEKKGNKVTVKIKSIFLRLVGGAALLVIVIFCGSFIWFANLQRSRNSRKKKLSADSNIIDAVDNFARHRIK